MSDAGANLRVRELIIETKEAGDFDNEQARCPQVRVVQVGEGRKEYRDGVGNDDRIGVKDLLEM